MQSDDPAFLPVGTEVSAKFKGAFCEAKVKKITKSVKCKVSLKEAPFGSIIVEEHLIKGGPLEVNNLVDVTQGKHTVKALIQHVKDCSSYHVVFNDGDEKILRRTQMCLKGAKHFDSAVSLDALPLYNPEQFSSPVVKGLLGKNKKGKKRKVDDISPSKRAKKRKEDEESEDEKGKKREKRAAASAATVAIGEIDQGDTEISGEGEDSSSGDSSDREKDKEREKKKNDKEDERKDTDKKSQKDKLEVEKRERDKIPFQMGDVICVYEEPQRRGKWFPAVVVAYKAYRDGALKPRTLSKKEIPVRSFQNGKYAGVMTNHLSWFDHNSFGKKTMEGMSSALKTAIDRAQIFIDRGTLPGSWVLKELYADENPPKRKELEERAEREIKKEKKEEKEKKEKEKKEEKVDKDDKKKKEKSEKEKPLKPSVAASESSSSEGSDEEEYGEERDLFVAQLYKFQEERGTPINRAPVLGGKDIDLYRFYRVVQDYGGCKRVTTNQKWKKVLTKLKLEGCAGATPVTVRKAYVRYLSHFNSFYKRLGWSLDELAATSTINSPRERRLIRPTDIVIQKGKRRKSNAGDMKEKVEKKEIKKEKSEEIDDAKSIQKESSVPVDSRDKEKDEKAERIKRESTSPAIFVASNDKVKRVEKEKDDSEYKKEDKEKRKDKREINEEDDKDKKKETPKIDKKDKKEKVKDKEEKNKESDPDTEKEKEPKKERKEREGDASDDEIEGKRKKEKKKLSMKSERKGDSADFIKSKDPDEGYNPANIFSHFYLGQKVRAHHHGRWYDARVVTVEQPNVREIVEVIVLSQEGESELSADSVSRLHSLMCATRCFVHYLGWNSRYDEWITLNKIRLSTKDEQASMDLVWRAVDSRVPASRIDWVLAWSNSPEGVDSLHRDDDTAPLNLFSMGGYRPRRVSISQYEQFSAAVVADGLKREQSKTSPIVTIASSPGKTLISPCPALLDSKPLNSTTGSNIYVKSEPLPFSTSLVSSLRSPSRVYESTSSPIRESKRIRTTSLSKELSKDVPSTSTSPIRPQSPMKLVQEVFHTFEIISPLCNSDSKSESDYIPSLILMSPVTAVISLTCKEPPPKEKETKEKKSPSRMIKVADRDQEKDLEKGLPKDKHKRKRKESDTEREEEKEFESLEEEAKAVCLLRHPSQDESDAAPSGSETPQRTDGEDNDKWSVSDNQSVSGRMMSPGRGRGMKRKRIVHNRHSQMVVDRKYVRGKQKDRDDKKDEDSDGEEEEEEVARDTFISMKNKVHRMMEQEQSLENFSPLGFPPLEDIMVMPEAEIVEILERRLNELREIYQHSKADLLIMDKKRRRQIEKRKERERALREASALPSVEK